MGRMAHCDQDVDAANSDNALAPIASSWILLGDVGNRAAPAPLGLWLRARTSSARLVRAALTTREPLPRPASIQSRGRYCGGASYQRRLSPRAYPSAHLRDEVLSALPDTLLSPFGFVTLADSGNPPQGNSHSREFAIKCGSWDLHVSQCHSSYH